MSVTTSYSDQTQALISALHAKYAVSKPGQKAKITKRLADLGLPLPVNSAGKPLDEIDQMMMQIKQSLAADSAAAEAAAVEQPATTEQPATADTDTGSKRRK
jgi:hypothetical protein